MFAVFITNYVEIICLQRPVHG